MSFWSTTTAPFTAGTSSRVTSSWDDNEDWRGDERRIVEKNAFNQAINGMMDWLPKDFESDQS